MGLLSRAAKAIRAYHGSPHDFDRFELSPRTIGTGEGAQAYGHGLYFAEAEDVARAYRDALGAKRPALGALHKFADVNGDILANTIYGQIQTGGTADEIVRRVLKLQPEAHEKKASIRAVVEQIKSADPGRMYEVNINADPETFLDWYQPFSRQSEYVKEALGEQVARIPKNNWTYSPDPEGGKVYRGLADLDHDFTGSRITRRLLDRGIPGIKFLDQGSRDAGEGTRNFVVFDDKLIEIIRKYGLPGAVGGGLLSRTFPQQETQTA